MYPLKLEPVGYHEDFRALMAAGGVVEAARAIVNRRVMVRPGVEP